MMNAQREMTLEEWCAQLPDFHLVNRQLRELKSTHPQPVTPEMVERLSATVDRIEELNARQDERGRKLDSAVTPVVDGESFICYLIDNCEREVIHEESLHEWLADFLKNPRYHKPVTPAGGEDYRPHPVVERGLETNRRRKAVELLQSLGAKWDGHSWSHPPVADAALLDADSYLRSFLAQCEREHTARCDQADLTRVIAALNQRGGGE